MTALVPRVGPPYVGRHRLDRIAHTIGADLDRDVAARRARDLIRDRVNDMRREDRED